MCGIAGIYSLNHQLENDTSSIKAMVNGLKHRGPDAQGVFNNTVVQLGHDRLSIIDLDTKANQPMHSFNERYVMVYNGEVYNFKELKNQVKVNNDALVYKTHSDTEVVLEAYAKWGVDFVNRLNGMFALAIYDKIDNHLFLFRDRLGIKPLYYYKDDFLFVFASEIKALLKNEQVRKNLSLNKKAINQFLHLGYIPGDESIYNEIKKLPQASRLHINKDHFEITSYWDIENKFDFDEFNNYSEAKRKLKHLLHSSVEYRMLADVSVGTFLSGGIDSSLVTAIAQSQSKQKINTFSIGFDHAKFDESAYAQKVAQHLGTNHYEFKVTESDCLAMLDEYMQVFDEPFADSSGFPTLLVSKLAKKHVSVCLSGDGGDEQFQGYGMYNWANRLDGGFYKTFSSPTAWLFSKMSSKYKRIAKMLTVEDEKRLKSHIFSQEQYFFKRGELSSLLKANFVEDFELNENYDLRRTLSPQEKQALFDLKYYLPDDLLVKVDRASMNYSLEVRVPLLDYRIVEFGLNLPLSFKRKGKNTKFILKDILFDYIPKSYFDRPKWGFSVPMASWLKKDLHYLIEQHLSTKSIEKYSVLNPDEVNKLLALFNTGKHDYLFNRIWACLVLQIWLDKNHTNFMS